MGSRLTRRGRVVVAIVWLALLGAGLGVLTGTDPVPDGRPDVGVTTTVEVRPGDTLWGIAGQLTPGADLRETVAAIVELNDLGPEPALRPGETLVVPSFDHTD
jgi:nucleoid-associated protein YgaU